jgi:OHCU decarboxylase
MPKVHPGATLTPHFRDFLPSWVARQPWYAGPGTPSLSPVGYFRFEDPAGEVGIETHLVADGQVLYQVPMTYRGAPLETAPPGALIASAQHSVLGTRWIYDGERDPAWHSQLLGLIRSGGVSDPSGKRGAGPAELRGRPLAPDELADDMVRVELLRVVTPGGPPDDPGICGLAMGTWHPAGPGTAPATGCLAEARKAGSRRAGQAAGGSGLDRLNGLPAEEAVAALLGCCRAPGWARRVAAGRPYRTTADLLGAAAAGWADRDSGDLAAAMAGHPRIGERGPGVAEQSRQEQSGVGSDPATLAALRDANAEYERRFGHVFLICAAGRGPGEILAELRRRLGNDPAAELDVAAAEIGEITALRLRKLAGQ